MSSNAETNYLKLTTVITSGDIQTLEDGLSSGEVDANTHYSTEQGITGLIYAAQVGSVESINCLVRHGARLNAKDNKGNTALTAAAVSGRKESVRALVDLGAKVNFQNQDGETALLTACERGDVEMTKCLVLGGATLNYECKRDHSTPLTRAVGAGSLEIVKCLVEKGANLARRYVYLESPLTIACRTVNMPIVEYLLNLEGCQDELRKNSRALVHASRTGNMDLVKLLVDSGAVLDLFDCDNNALISSCTHGHINVCKYLLSEGADINQANVYGYTPLISASANGHTEIVRLLLSSGCSVDQVNGSGRTALMEASFRDLEDVAKSLLEAGASVSFQTKNGDTVLTLAASNKSQVVLQLLLKSDTCIIKALDQDSEGTNGRSFLNIDHQNKQGDSALMIAARKLQVKSIDSLLDAGANPLLCNHCGQTALEVAMNSWMTKNFSNKYAGKNSFHTSPSAVDVLILRGGISPGALYFAIRRRQRRLVKTMMKHGALPSLELQYSSMRSSHKILVTPFSMSLLNRSTEMAKYFLNRWFLHEHDVNDLRYSVQFREMLKSSKFPAPGSLALLDEVFSQPWTLVSLSFLVVSNAIGFGPCRKERVARTGLPELFKQSLMFSDDGTDVPVSDWSSLSLECIHGRCGGTAMVMK